MSGGEAVNSRTARLIRKSGLPLAIQRDLKRKWPTFSHRERAILALDLAQARLNRQQQMPPPPVQVGPVEGVG